jgi:hypothetical protein
VYLFSLASSAIITIALFFALTLVFLPNQQKNVSPPNPVVNSFTGVYTLQNLEQQVQGISQKVSESVVSIVISRDVEVFRSDPFGFFRESAGTVRRKV